MSFPPEIRARASRQKPLISQPVANIQRLAIRKATAGTSAIEGARADLLVDADGKLWTNTADASALAAAIGSKTDAAWDGITANPSLISLQKAIWIKLP